MARKDKEQDLSPQQKFMRARKEMSESLIERESEVDVLLTSLLAKVNPLFVGPPGTAKSLLVKNLLKWMSNDISKFDLVLDKYTTPEHLFGPISVKGLTSDVYRRITTGRLPEAHIAFVDEVFKGSTAILNTMLPVMNERVYDNGDGKPQPIPLLMLVSGSNEWPQDSNELGALFDRFLVRKPVRPILTEEGEERLLWARDFDPVYSCMISQDEIEQAHKEAMELDFTDKAKEAFVNIRKELNKEGIFPGDRRRFKSVSVCQAYAYLCGDQEVEPDHLEMLAHTMWVAPVGDHPKKCAEVVARIAKPINMKLNSFRDECENILTTCTPTEAVPKLKEIQTKLREMDETEKVEKLDRYVTKALKMSYDRVVGVKEGDDE